MLESALTVRTLSWDSSYASKITHVFGGLLNSTLSSIFLIVICSFWSSYLISANCSGNKFYFDDKDKFDFESELFEMFDADLFDFQLFNF